MRGAQLRRSQPAFIIVMVMKLVSVSVYIYCWTWRLVTYVRRRPSRALRPRHDVAGPNINMDLVEAEVRRKASGCGGGLQPD